MSGKPAIQTENQWQAYLATTPAEFVKPKQEVSFASQTFLPDEESGSIYNQEPSEHVAFECYTQPEEMELALDSAAWRAVLKDAGIPEKYHITWLQYIAGAPVEALRQDHYRFILRAGEHPKWQPKLRAAIEKQGVISWNNHLARNKRPLAAEEYHPVAQGSVTTLCKQVKSSRVMHWKDGEGVDTERTRYDMAEADAPAGYRCTQVTEAVDGWVFPFPIIEVAVQQSPDAPRKPRTSTTRYITGCNGFRANMQGVQLDEYRQSFQSSIASLVVS